MIPALRRFARTPKGLLTIALGILLALGLTGDGMSDALPELLAATLTAMALDAPILRVREGKWVFPDGALLTGLIIAMVFSPLEPWYVAAVTSGIAIVSKYALRLAGANVFNPAAFALVASYFIFDTEQSWWGALPELWPVAIVALIAVGLFIADRVKKMPAVVSFLGVYYLLVTLHAFVGDPAPMANLYRAPDLHAALYFAFFMVSDPPTSPPKRPDQWLFGAIVGAASYGCFVMFGGVYYLLSGVLVGNVWEGYRRWRAKAAHAARRARAPVAA